MTAADPRVCCPACEVFEDDSCRDLYCACHDYVVNVEPDEPRLTF